MTVDALVPTAFSWQRFLAVAGPGIVVMLADTDAGSVITAAQSGAQWGYSLLLLQIVLIPILYIVQELTVRLGAVTGKGHAALIKQHFGAGWAWFSVATLIVTCLGALLTEFAGLSGVGNLMGVPAPVTLALVVAAMLAMALMNGYATVERIAIGVGAFELVLLLVAMLAHPGLAEMASGAITIPIARSEISLLVSANIGAVIMPWMVFFQQSSIVEKGIDGPRPRVGPDGHRDRRDRDPGHHGCGADRDGGDARQGRRRSSARHGRGDRRRDHPVPRQFHRQALFCLGMIGASTVAAIVVTLTAARTLAEVLGAKHKLEDEPREAPWFYGFYALALIVCAVVVGLGREPRVAQRRRPGDERAAAADRARVPVPARPPPAPALPLAGRLRMVRGRDHPCDGGVRSLFRRRGPVGVRARHPTLCRPANSSLARKYDAILC